jgi:hypothetical protein
MLGQKIKSSDFYELRTEVLVVDGVLHGKSYVLMVQTASAQNEVPGSISWSGLGNEGVFGFLQ